MSSSPMSRQHVQSDHPDMVGRMTRDKILEMAHDA